jgi:hypothetical protein
LAKEYLKCDWSSIGTHHLARIDRQLEEMKMQNIELMEKIRKLERILELKEG